MNALMNIVNVIGVGRAGPHRNERVMWRVETLKSDRKSVTEAKVWCPRIAIILSGNFSENSWTYSLGLWRLNRTVTSGMGCQWLVRLGAPLIGVGLALGLVARRFFSLSRVLRGDTVQSDLGAFWFSSRMTASMRPPPAGSMSITSDLIKRYFLN